MVYHLFVFLRRKMQTRLTRKPRNIDVIRAQSKVIAELSANYNKALLEIAALRWEKEQLTKTVNYLNIEPVELNDK